MSKEKSEPNEKSKNKMAGGASGAGGAVYCLGFIGALVYYIQQATTFGQGVIGVLKAIVWPAILVYKSLEILKL